jgi:cytochrome c553
MSALFPRWTNTAYRLSLTALAATAIAGLAGAMIYMRTPWNTQQFDAVDQPVQFDHRHHVIDDGIDCIYCHQSVETSDYAGVPATDVCMGCHAQVWNESPLLETVRRSYFSGRAIPWNRVHDLPDFVYFSHAVHVQRGVGCVACHGRVDQMARVYATQALTMGFCLDCHSHATELPERSLMASASYGGDTRFADERTAQPALFGSLPASVGSSLSLGPERHDALTTCSACHR